VEPWVIHTVWYCLSHRIRLSWRAARMRGNQLEMVRGLKKLWASRSGKQFRIAGRQACQGGFAADTVAAAVAVVVACRRPGVVVEAGSVRIASGAVVAGTDASGAGLGPGISGVDQSHQATEDIDSLGLPKKLEGLNIIFCLLLRNDEEQTVEAVLQLKLRAYRG
jgi:hypothetical protein